MILTSSELDKKIKLINNDPLKYKFSCTFAA